MDLCIYLRNCILIAYPQINFTYNFKKCNSLFVNFNFKTITNKFDIIFLDPPYKEKKFNYIIDSITEKKILNKSGIIIIHRHKKDNDKFSDNLKILEEKKYGISKIFFGILN